MASPAPSLPDSSSFGSPQTVSSGDKPESENPVNSSFGSPQTVSSGDKPESENPVNSSFGSPQTVSSGDKPESENPVNSSFGSPQTGSSGDKPESENPVNSSFGSPQTGSSGDKPESENLFKKCNICQNACTSPKILLCLHTFCQSCLENLDSPENIVCPVCNTDCNVLPQSTSELPSDYHFSDISENTVAEDSALVCTGCKTENARHAVARCYDCANYLCDNCFLAHQFMHCFEKHEVVNLKELAKDDFKTGNLLYCPKHKGEILRFFCRTCDMPICKQCTNIDHPNALHDYDPISEVGRRQIEILSFLLEQSKAKPNDLRNAAKTIDYFTSSLQMQYRTAKDKINSTFNFYSSVLEQRKQDLMKELEDLFNAKMASLGLINSENQEMIERIQQMSVFVDRLMKFSSNSEILMFKHLLDTKLQAAVAYNPDVSIKAMNLEFLSNYGAIKDAVIKTFGYIRHNTKGTRRTKPQSIAKIKSVINCDASFKNGHVYEPNTISEGFCSDSNVEHFTTSFSNVKPYEKLSSDPSHIFQKETADSLHPNTTETDIDSSPDFISADTYPIQSKIKRQIMTYHCKFGGFGVMEGQCTEPKGVAVDAQNNIVLADTNNHRIQIFDKEGRFKFQFGLHGTRDGQLVHPNRVAVAKMSGDIIITERHPTHQIQIYNRYGQFVRKFGSTILQHPRGVAVDIKGRIIVVECKVMRVTIFDQLGNVLQRFGCAKHIEFPNGIAVNDKREIFICDNKAHCVKIFNYDGTFLRQIGGEGITNYPFGVCINKKREILVADNHNNFNLTIFTQDGQLVKAFESKVKHAECFDIAATDEGSVVLTSKDQRLYIYRYIKIPGIAI